MDKLYDILYHWNLWGRWEIPPNTVRDILPKVIDSLSAPETIALIGPRRAGKSTVMYQVMQHLMAQEEMAAAAILHVSFEEPAFVADLDLALLDQIYETYRQRIFPKGRAYIFLDEIQNVPGWERWVRARNETEDIKIFVTGSSATMMSRELATLLTGRHLTFDIHPLSFKELLRFRGITLPNTPYPNKAPHDVQHALHDYLTWGGFPRVVLSDQEVRKKQLLTRYLDDLLFKDIIMRHRVRDAATLRNLAIYLLQQTASLSSIKRLTQIFQSSYDLMKSYVDYLQEAFIIEGLSYFTMKSAEVTRRPFKTHAIDLGLHHVVMASAEPDLSKTVETAVFQHLFQQEDEKIFYWEDNVEIDFVSQNNTNQLQLVQVVSSGLEQDKVFQRELKSFDVATKHFPQADKILVTYDMPATLAGTLPKDVTLIPLWQYLLEGG